MIKLLAILFVAGVGLASILDHRRLAATGTRDHLFPDDQWYRSRVLDPDAEYDPLMPVLVGRYRRLRNGMHTTVDATSTQWPPRSEAHPAPLAELSRLGRAAGVPVGPGTSSSGWTPDPESPDGFRFVGASGFTAYVANQVFSEPVATVVSERSAQEADPGKKEQAAPDGGDEALGDVDFEHAGLDGSDLGASYLGASYLDDGEFDDVDLDGDGFGDVELGDGEFDEMEIDDADPSGSQFGAAGFEESEFGAPYFDDLKPEEELREQIVVAKSAENGATTTSVSTPKVRVEAMGWSEPPRSPLYCWRLALGSIGIGLLLALRGLTAGEPSTAILEPAVSLPDATNSPVLILGLVGAAAALVSIRGRNPVVLGAGWEVGPGEDRTSDRSDEREA